MGCVTLSLPPGEVRIALTLGTDKIKRLDNHVRVLQLRRKALTVTLFEGQVLLPGAMTDL